MPWTSDEFADKHNHKLHGEAADVAARQATALVNKGMPDGEAIAIANKTGDRKMVRSHESGGKIKSFPIPSSPAPSGGERPPEEGPPEGQKQASFAQGGMAGGSCRYAKG
jgi:hypothetical protein